MARPLAESTRRVYARHWNAWADWARSRSLSVLPASAYWVTAYIRSCAILGASKSTVLIAKAAISAYHRDGGHPDPTTDQEFRCEVADLLRDGSQPQAMVNAGGHADLASIHAADTFGRVTLRQQPQQRFPKPIGFSESQRSEFILDPRPRQVPLYSTDFGEAWVGDSRKLLKKIRDESIDLVITSPPYGLIKKKEYGNESQEDYVRWFRPFAKEIHRVLKPTGSFVINIAGAWQKGQPTRALYPYRLILDLCEPDRRRKSAPAFHLAQEFYWLNPAKIPNPVQWANVTRERVKDAVEPVWWLSKSPHPKASNRKVLVPYSEHMQRLLKTGKYNAGSRPSGWNISKVWARDNGGAIPSNFESDDALAACPRNTVSVLMRV